MKHPYSQVREFHQRFEIASADSPNLAPPAIRELRKRILQEEFNEYLHAEATDDLVEIADALADMVYVAIGTALAYGIPFDAIFDEVHRSNMSKLGTDGRPIKRADGKIQKGPNFEPPRISRILSGVSRR